MDFGSLTTAIAAQYKKIEAMGTLYVTDVSKEELWDVYLNAFPENEVLFENREYDCNTCKKFIKAIANVVYIDNTNVLHTVWDVDVPADSEYLDVIDAMRDLIKSREIVNKFIIRPNITNKGMVGLVTNTVEESNTTLHRDKIGMTFHHLHAEVDKSLIRVEAPTILSKVSSKHISYKNACEAISLDTITLLKDLISNGLYRGEEHLPAVIEFEKLLVGYEKASNKNIYLWRTLDGPHRKIKSTVIGTLLMNLMVEDIDAAVGKYESHVAPSNYKRTNAIVTPRMREQHLKIIQDAGIEDSLYKRYAVLSDVSVNDVLFVDSSVSEKMLDGIAGLMVKGTSKKVVLGKNIQDISLGEFISDVLPKAHSISLLLENKHRGNLVSLIAPKVVDAPNIQAWNNNFSWAYIGGVADSMQQLVKAAGGDITGDLRFSIQWNEARMDEANDLDAHCVDPYCHIMYSKKSCSKSGGSLDVDITTPGNEVAVENITYPTTMSMPDGTYEFTVVNYWGINIRGFRAEVEILGDIFEYDYPTSVTRDVKVATVTLESGKFTIEHHLEPTISSKEIWGIKTQELHKVTSIMYSPNYWEGGMVGNKHTFFMLEGCVNPDAVRGLYNEHLHPKFRDIRKSIDMLAPMLMCEPTPEQISGIGISSTKVDEFLFVVRGDGIGGTFRVKSRT